MTFDDRSKKRHRRIMKEKGFSKKMFNIVTDVTATQDSQLVPGQSENYISQINSDHDFNTFCMYKKRDVLFDIATKIIDNEDETKKKETFNFFLKNAFDYEKMEGMFNGKGDNANDGIKHHKFIKEDFRSLTWYINYMTHDIAPIDIANAINISEKDQREKLKLLKSLYDVDVNEKLKEFGVGEEIIDSFIQRRRMNFKESISNHFRQELHDAVGGIDVSNETNTEKCLATVVHKIWKHVTNEGVKKRSGGRFPKGLNREVVPCDFSVLSRTEKAYRLINKAKQLFSSGMTNMLTGIETDNGSLVLRGYSSIYNLHNSTFRDRTKGFMKDVKNKNFNGKRGNDVERRKYIHLKGETFKSKTSSHYPIHQMILDWHQSDEYKNDKWGMQFRSDKMCATSAILRAYVLLREYMISPLKPIMLRRELHIHSLPGYDEEDVKKFKEWSPEKREKYERDYRTMLRRYKVIGFKEDPKGELNLHTFLPTLNWSSWGDVTKGDDSMVPNPFRVNEDMWFRKIMGSVRFGYNRLGIGKEARKIWYDHVIGFDYDPRYCTKVYENSHSSGDSNMDSYLYHRPILSINYFDPEESDDSKHGNTGNTGPGLYHHIHKDYKAVLNVNKIFDYFDYNEQNFTNFHVKNEQNDENNLVFGRFDLSKENLQIIYNTSITSKRNHIHGYPVAILDMYKHLESTNGKPQFWCDVLTSHKRNTSHTHEDSSTKTGIKKRNDHDDRPLCTIPPPHILDLEINPYTGIPISIESLDPSLNPHESLFEYFHRTLSKSDDLLNHLKKFSEHVHSYNGLNFIVTRDGKTHGEANKNGIYPGNGHYTHPFVLMPNESYWDLRIPLMYLMKEELCDRLEACINKMLEFKNGKSFIRDNWCTFHLVRQKKNCLSSKLCITLRTMKNVEHNDERSERILAPLIQCFKDVIEKQHITAQGVQQLRENMIIRKRIE
jgi:hypothetical protein